MRQGSLVSTILVLLLVWSTVYGTQVTGAPASESSVEATISCSFDDGASLTVRASMIVKRITVFETTYDRQAIEDMAATNPYVMGAIMLRLHDSVKTLVESTFSYADVQTLTTMPSYQKPYFTDDFRVALTPTFFQYNGSLNLTNIIGGFLDMGATVTYHCSLQPETGWNTTFVYQLPREMTLSYANTADTNSDSNTATWVVRNWAGNELDKEAVLSVQAKNPTTKASEKEDITLEYILDARSVNNVSFTNSILMKQVNIRRYNVLPGFITGVGSLPADGVRLCIENGLLSWDDLFETTVEPIKAQTTPMIENSSFKQSLQLSFSWDPESTVNCSAPYNISSMDDYPALRANFKDSDVRMTICQIHSRAFFGLMHAGAAASISSVDVNFGLGLEAMTHPYENILRLPANITLEGKNVYTWNKTTPVAGTFRSDLQPTPPYTQEHVETRIEIELVKMDLNILSALTGKTELTASMKMKEDNRLYVIRRSDEFLFSPKITVMFLNADAFRLCVEEGVFGDADIDEYLLKRTVLFQQRLSEIIQGMQVKGFVDRPLFSSSLTWDGDISTMDALTPVIVSNYANEVHKVGFNISLWPVSLTLVPQHFALQAFQNQTVTYRIIFPRGVSVNASERSGNSFIMGMTSDGREYVEMSFDAASMSLSTELTCVMTVSPVFILGLFLPCILVFILLVVLVVIIYLIRKKKGGFRRGKRRLFEPEDAEPADYVDDEQEYYVPPPPSSKRRR